MSKQFCFDLRLARRKSGFTQCDIAHLMNCHQSKIVALEKGEQLPSLEQVCTLSVIFGRSFEGLYAELLQDARSRIRGSLSSLPEKCGTNALSSNREASLKRLERRLLEFSDRDHAG